MYELQQYCYFLFFASSLPKTSYHRKLKKIESKEALNVVFKVTQSYNKDIEFYGLQIDGLKGHMISTKLEKNGLYTSQNVDTRIRFPLTNSDVYDHTNHMIRSLLKFKVVLRSVCTLKKTNETLILGKMLCRKRCFGEGSHCKE